MKKNITSDCKKIISGVVKQDISLVLPAHKQHNISHSTLKPKHLESKLDIKPYMSIIKCNYFKWSIHTKQLKIENNSLVNLFRNLSHKKKTKTNKTLTMFYLYHIKAKLKYDNSINKRTRKYSSSSMKLLRN